MHNCHQGKTNEQDHTKDCQAVFCEGPPTRPELSPVRLCLLTPAMNALVLDRHGPQPILDLATGGLGRSDPGQEFGPNLFCPLKPGQLAG